MAQLAARCGCHVAVWASDGHSPFELSDEATPDCSVLDCVCASCALPLVFPPAVLPGSGSDRVLSDGCVSTPLPGWNDPRFPSHHTLRFAIDETP